MSEIDIKMLFLDLGITLKVAAIDAIEDYVWNECKFAKEEQKKKDVIASVAALCDAGVKEEQLYGLLYQYFHIDSRAEATEYIKKGKNIEFPLKKLIVYLKENGYSYNSIRNFIEKHNVCDKLENDSKLCELSMEKLKEAVEKN